MTPRRDDDLPSGMDMLTRTIQRIERDRVLDAIWDARVEIVMGGVESLRRVLDTLRKGP